MNARKFINLAVAGVLIAAGVASGQTMVDRSGANDANNRVGSNGKNAVVNRPNPWDVANAIVEGNVTGGKQFRGNVQSGDPFAFRGATGNLTQDRFVRDSSGVTTNGVTSFNANETRSYYGDSRAVPPPPGYVGIPSTGGYTPPTPQQWKTFDPRQQSISPQAAPLNANDGIADPGIVNFAYNVNGFPVTPALQPQQLNPSALSDYTNLNQGNLSTQLTTEQLTRLRQEIGQGNDNTPGYGTQPANNVPNGINNSMQPQTPDTRLNDSLQNNAVNGSAPLDNSIQTQQVPEPGLVTKLAGPNSDVNANGQANGQSNGTNNNAGNNAGTAQQPQRPGEAAQNAADQFNAQLRARKAAEEKAKNADQPAPGAPANQPPINMNAPPPSVHTLAGVTKAKGLSDLLTKAEDQMRQGKFASAIDTYNTAITVDPHNATIKVGRVNAELGGAYYRRAEATLRQIPPADRHVLVGRYDLRGFIGDDRLQLAQKDLSDLIQKAPNDTGAAILLAYVYDNTGNERRAIALLDLADKRASGKDQLVQFLKKNWTVAAEQK